MREAIIKNVDGMYVVELYPTMFVDPENSWQEDYYAEDVKENWENGLIKV